MSEIDLRNAPPVLKKENKGEIKSALKNVMFDGRKDDKFMTIFTRSGVNGPNTNLAKGPKDELLL